MSIFIQEEEMVDNNVEDFVVLIIDILEEVIETLINTIKIEGEN